MNQRVWTVCLWPDLRVCVCVRVSAATGITFNPSTVTVASGATSSASFKAIATAGTTAGTSVVSVALTGAASNIGTRCARVHMQKHA